MDASTRTGGTDARRKSSQFENGRKIGTQWGSTTVPTRHLFIANCGPAVGISFSAIDKAFSSIGADVADVRAAGDGGNRVIVTFQSVESASAVREAWSDRPCELLNGRMMRMEYSNPRSQVVLVEALCSASTTSAELGIRGLTMYPDFASLEEEQGMLAVVDSLPWQTLAKRRVQHYGYEFLYKSRNVNVSQKMGSLPSFVEPMVRRMSALPDLTATDEISLPLDQLTVNEYPKGVGLSPHIDTHSAFEGSILSLSLDGPCVMEFRRYPKHSENPGPRFGIETPEGHIENSACLSANGLSRDGMERKVLFLPQRSLLVLSDEARYAWHHYIPHHKVDLVNGKTISRGARRVSFTFRKVRGRPCTCRFPEDCDSQLSRLPPDSVFTKEAVKHLHEGTGGQDLFGEETQILIPVGNGVEQQQPQVRHTGECDDMEQADSNSAFGANVLASEESQGMHEAEETESNVSFTSRDTLPTPEIEKLYVHQVYDAIAPHFSATRFAKWPKVAQFLNSLAPGSLITDSGCGNGKYLGFNSKCFSIGCDISPSLVGICAKRGHETLVADALQLPYRSGFFDAGISIAVLHHLSNDGRRTQAIKELLRTVRSGGFILITVWAREQEDVARVKKWLPLATPYLVEWVNSETFMPYPKKQNRAFALDRIPEQRGSDNATSADVPEPSNRSDWQGQKSNPGTCRTVEGDVGQAAGIPSEQQEYFVPWHLPYHRAEINGRSAAAVASGFAKKDEKKGTVVYNRYYHVFAEGELERLVSKIDGAVVVDRFYDKSNWCVILQKF